MLTRVFSTSESAFCSESNENEWMFIETKLSKQESAQQMPIFISNVHFDGIETGTDIEQ